MAMGKRLGWLAHIFEQNNKNSTIKSMCSDTTRCFFRQLLIERNTIQDSYGYFSHSSRNNNTDNNFYDS
jgi:hypothetical protein